MPPEEENIEEEISLRKPLKLSIKPFKKPKLVMGKNPKIAKKYFNGQNR